MDSLITLVIFAIIASVVQSAVNGKKNKGNTVNRRPVSGGQGMARTSSSEMLKQIVAQQVATMSVRKQESQNEAEWSDAFENEAAYPVEGITGNDDGAAVTDEGKYLTNENIGFGVLSYNSDEGKELEAYEAQQPVHSWTDPNQPVHEEAYLDIDRTDFQKAFVLSEILGQPRALKLKIK